MDALLQYQADARVAPINWAVTAVLGLTFLAAVTVVPWYGIVHGYNGSSWLFFGIFLVLNGIGIGSGYHRLWSHRTYEAHPLLRWFLAVMGGRCRTALSCGRRVTAFTTATWMMTTRIRIQSDAVSGLRTLAGC